MSTEHAEQVDQTYQEEQAEQGEQPCLVPNGNIAHRPVRKKPSKHHVLESLDACICFPRPIWTFIFRRRAKLTPNLGDMPGTELNGQNAIPVSPQTATQGEQMPNSPIVSEQPVPTISRAGEHGSHVHTQAKSYSHAKNDTLPARHGRLPIGPAQPPTPPESICTLATGTNTKERTTVSNLVPGGLQTQAESSSAQKGIKAFILRDKCLYEATKIHPEKDLRDQWRSSGKPTIDKRLKNLRLGPNILFNLRLCMMGPSADEKSMRPTILIVCDKNRVKEVQNALKEFVRVSFPEYVDFKVIAGSVRLASGAICSLPSMPGDRTDLTVMTFAEAGSFPFLAIAGQFGLDYNRHYKNIWRSDVHTIGGTIAVGNSLYGLTVAHSVRKGRSLLNSSEKHRFYTFCGGIEFYEWSGQEENKLEDPAGPAKWRMNSAVAMDWMLLRLDKRYTSLNRFSAFDGAVQQNVSGFVRTADLLDGEVWIFSTHPQTGILDSAPSTIVLGQVSYEVLSIALEFPLDDGDSGSWVVRDHRLCGYIFARLDGAAWAYMIPIEPVFGEISRIFSKDVEVKVDVPDATTIKSWLLSGDRAANSKVDNASTKIALAGSPGRPVNSRLQMLQMIQESETQLGTRRP